MSRSCSFEDQNSIAEIINRILKDATDRTLANQHKSFKPRSIEKIVKNCSKLDEKIKVDTVQIIASFLLSKNTAPKNFSFGDVSETSKGFSWNDWNSGGNTGFIAPGKSGKKIGFTTIFWKVRESQGKSGKKKLFACLVRESQGNF